MAWMPMSGLPKSSLSCCVRAGSMLDVARRTSCPAFVVFFCFCFFHLLLCCIARLQRRSVTCVCEALRNALAAFVVIILGLLFGTALAFLGGHTLGCERVLLR